MHKELSKARPTAEFFKNFELKRLNNVLEEMNNSLQSLAARFELDEITYNADMLIEQYKISVAPKIKKSKPINMIFDFIDQYKIYPRER